MGSLAGCSEWSPKTPGAGTLAHMGGGLATQAEGSRLHQPGLAWVCARPSLCGSGDFGTRTTMASGPVTSRGRFPIRKESYGL